MINIYAPGATDWASNGLAILLPTECKISETAGGSYELELAHPVTDDMRWETITEGCVIKAPVPAAETPYISLYKEGSPGVPGVPQRIIHAAYTGDNWSAVNIYEKPDTSSKVLAKLWAGMEYEYLSAHSSLFHVGTDQFGNVGYIQNINSYYVRTEEAVIAIPGVIGYSTISKPRQIRTQLFRAYHVEMDTENHIIKAWARHISYDFMGNICGNLKLNKVELPAALDQLKASMITPESRALIAGITTEISGEWQHENGIKVLLDPDDGFVAKARCKIIRDNSDIFMLENTATDRHVKIEYGKNLNGVKWTKRSDAVVTRIVPVGRNADNTNLLLPETYVDSEYISIYPVIYTQKLDVPDAKVSDTMTAEQAYTAMRNAAAAEFAKGCDLISFDLDVDFIQLGDTEEYKQYKDLQQVFLYDAVTITHSPSGLSAKAQVRGFEWDAILGRYIKVTLGDVFEVSGSTIAGYQLPTGGISGTKLVPGGVGSDQLRSLSVLSAHIGLAEIKTANLGLAIIEKGHMKEALINDLKADSIEAVRAHIQQLVADQVTADQLFANIASIALAQITTANIENANIEWADIETLKAAMVNALQARIQYLIANALVTDELYAALAEIATAEIGTAEIDWAKIKDLVSGRQIFTEGVGGKLYIADLAVTEANMVSLTVGELIVRGADGLFYAVGVDVEGNITTTLKQIADGDIEDEGITGSTKIIEGSVTADRLNATDIFADNAIIRQLMAANLDVDTFFAREGVVNKLTLDYVQPLNDAITIKLNEQAIYTSPVAPTTPQVDKMWLDTSTNPEQLKRWTGTEWAVVSKSKTDGYISMGTIKMPGGGTEFGVAVGEGVDALDVDGEIPTTERSMSVQTAKAYMILTGGEQVFDVDATGADAKSFRGESVVIDGAWVETTTPTKGFVLKWGG